MFSDTQRFQIGWQEGDFHTAGFCLKDFSFYLFPIHFNPIELAECIRVINSISDMEGKHVFAFLLPCSQCAGDIDGTSDFHHNVNWLDVLVVAVADNPIPDKIGSHIGFLGNRHTESLCISGPAAGHVLHRAAQGGSGGDRLMRASAKGEHGNRCRGSERRIDLINDYTDRLRPLYEGVPISNHPVPHIIDSGVVGLGAFPFLCKGIIKADSFESAFLVYRGIL